MVEKNFDGWNTYKKDIDLQEKKFYRIRDIWWGSLGLNVGVEMNGKGSKYQRSILILKNMEPDMCFVVPLTTAGNKSFYRIPIGIIDGAETFAAISQLRLIDTKRLIYKITTVDEENFENVRKAVRNLF